MHQMQKKFLVICLHLELEHLRGVFDQSDVRGHFLLAPCGRSDHPNTIVTWVVASTVVVKQLPTDGERPRI
jgi:hypothetical protein